MLRKLDLTDYMAELTALFSREKHYILEGDIHVHYDYIQKLDNKEFSSPPFVKNLESELMYLKKSGVLNIGQIFEFIKMIRYFIYLKAKEWEDVHKWFSKIDIPKEISDIEKFFDKKGELHNIEELDMINQAVKINKSDIKQTLYRIINSKKMEPFLVDRQIHLLNGEDCLMVRGGFNKFIHADIIGRSATGYFYILPHDLNKLKAKEAELLSKKEEIIYSYAKSFSTTFGKWTKFLAFIDREFDRFDHYQARLLYAKSKGYTFILPSRDKRIILKNFCHPALKECKSVSLSYEKNILLITGVNAGGKTMLLKSILSAAFMAKYLLPMHAHSQSKIGHFKEIVAIIDDPQNVKNDISTFAGRIHEFSKLFSKRDALIGVDEIELGTDANEAATLFKVILTELIQQKIVITTHHKRLAALLADREEVELLAAIYDEKEQKPTYDFIHGTIGKSYAFETALKYGIPHNIIKRAKREYGEDLENLSELIEKSAKLELEMKLKTRELDEKLSNVEKLEFSLKEQKITFNENIEKEKNRLLTQYNEAINEAKAAIKAKDTKEAHQKLNAAHQKRSAIQVKKEEIKKELHVGDRVKYFHSKGTILSLSGKNASVDIDGKTLKVPIGTLKKTVQIKEKKKTLFIKPKPNSIDVKLDLHGKRFEEAMELADEFINNALLANLNEIIIYHGMGKGVLAKGIKELLKEHPLVTEYHDAPQQMGGFGATIVKL